MMRILVVTPTYLPIVGGAEVGIYEVYRRLAARHQVRILTPDLTGHIRGCPVSPVEFVHELDVIRFRDTWSGMNLRGHRVTRGMIPPFSLSQIFHLARQVREFAPDVINMHYAIPGGLAAVISQRLLRVPVVLSLVGRDVPGPHTPPMWKRYVKAIAGQCARTILISDYCRHSVFGRNAPRSSKVIPYGTDLNKFKLHVNKADIRAKLCLPPDGTLLLAVQRLVTEKRVDVVIRAAGVLAAENRKLLLAIVGTGPCMGELIQLATSAGLNGQMRFLGQVPREELVSLYQAADIFVFHSTYETFGVVLVEAMAAGLPIVTVNNTAIPELVRDGENGILVQQNDHSAMAAAVNTLIGDPALRAKMGEFGGRLAAKYDWQTIAEQYEDVLYEAAAHQKQR